MPYIQISKNMWIRKINPLLSTFRVVAVARATRVHALKSPQYHRSHVAHCLFIRMVVTNDDPQSPRVHPTGRVPAQKYCAWRPA